jgi:hypothetical protein
MESPLRKTMRQQASINMKKAAIRLNRYRANLDPPLKVGDVVTLAVPTVDKGPTDALRLPGVVVEVTDHNNYRIGVRAGVLKRCLPRPELNLRPNATPESFGLQYVLLNWRQMKKVGVRTGAARESVTGGQGLVSCKCKKTTCRTNQCKCYKAGQLCTTRCHKHENKCLNNGLDGDSEYDNSEENSSAEENSSGDD